ncbi:MAG: hypothetical protein ACTHOF_07175 [Flavisolibacter sp.]
MSTIIVAFIVIAVVIAICYFLIYTTKRHAQKKTGKLLSISSQTGSKYNLSFSSQEILKNRIIGLDGISRKLLVIEHDTAENDYSIIDLQDVKSCSVKKKYITVNMGDEKSKRMEEFLSTIVLQFNFKNGKEPFVLPFYESISNHVYEMKELEDKAKDWEAMLQKMLSNETKERA